MVFWTTLWKNIDLMDNWHNWFLTNLKQELKKKNWKSYQIQNSAHLKYHLDLALPGFSGLSKFYYFKYQQVKYMKQELLNWL